MNMIEAAYALADSRQMCCRADLDLLGATLDDCLPHPAVIQLGAGSGTMALMIIGHRRQPQLWTVDNDAENLGWEALALSNAGLAQDAECYAQLEGDSQNVDLVFNGGFEPDSIHLLIIDADHSYEGVKADLRVWLPMVVPGGYIFIHDYDGTTAPNQYPGVRKAADEVLHRPPFRTGGWSAVFIK